MTPTTHTATAPQRNPAVIGLVIMAFGAMALLDSVQAFGMPLVRTLWPLVLVVAGLARIVKPANAGSWISGAALIAVGLMLTGQNLDLFHLSHRQWGPVFMILGGLALLLRGVFPHGRR